MMSLLVAQMMDSGLDGEGLWLEFLPSPGTLLGPLAQILGLLSGTHLFVAAPFGGAASSGRYRLGWLHLGSPVVS